MVQAEGCPPRFTKPNDEGHHRCKAGRRERTFFHARILAGQGGFSKLDRGTYPKMPMVEPRRFDISRTGSTAVHVADMRRVCRWGTAMERLSAGVPRRVNPPWGTTGVRHPFPLVAARKSEVRHCRNMAGFRDISRPARSAGQALPGWIKGGGTNHAAANFVLLIGTSIRSLARTIPSFMT